MQSGATRSQLTVRASQLTGEHSESGWEGRSAHVLAS